MPSNVGLQRGAGDGVLAIRPGIWMMRDGEVDRVAVFSGHKIKQGQKELFSIYWWHSKGGNDAAIMLWPDTMKCLEEIAEVAMRDVTREYFEDSASFNHLLSQAPDLVSLIFLARPELDIPEPVMANMLDAMVEHEPELLVKLYKSRPELDAPKALLARLIKDPKKERREIGIGLISRRKVASLAFIDLYMWPAR